MHDNDNRRKPTPVPAPAAPADRAAIKRASRAAGRQAARLIVSARSERGMTQAELAEACGMKASNLCRLESGAGNPSVATLSRIARALGRDLVIRFE